MGNAKFKQMQMEREEQAVPCFTFSFVNRLTRSQRRLPTEAAAGLNGPLHQYLLMEIKGSDGRSREERRRGLRRGSSDHSPGHQ